MKLNQSQIDSLYAFTRAHFVVYYDLQTELVDHLANDIEAMWLENPELLFEDAKKKAFKKFGVFGFMEPIEQKQKAMGKRYMRYFWYELKQWFTLPKLLLTVSLFAVLYFLFLTPIVKYAAVLIFIGIGVWCSCKSVQLNRAYKKRKEKSNKKWMLEDILFKQASGMGFIFISQASSFFRFSEVTLNNNYVVLSLAVGFTFFVLLSYISFELLPNKAEKLLKETYPEFSL